MFKKYLFGLIVLYSLSACSVFDEDFPYKDDPTTVGNFKSSKFNGFWEVQNYKVQNNSGYWVYKPILYIFRGNTFQSFGDMDNPNNTSIFPEINDGRLPKEFLYSDTVIYTKEFYDTYEWKKTPYKISSDGNDMTFDKYNLLKIEIDPWKKEDIFGSWYKIEYDKLLVIYTFKENSLVMRSFKNGSLVDDKYLEISMTDEYYEQKNSTRCYYYLYDNKLLFSHIVLKRYTDLQN